MIEEKTDCTRMLASEKSDSSSTLAQREGETWSLPSRSQIRSCMAHASNAGCSNIDCRDLHICRVYLRGSACKFGKTCRFGHDLSTSHNELCLRRHGVPGADINAVRRLWSACRGAEELPWICTFYNSAAGCRYGEEGGGCTKLHVCAYYVKGNCAYEGKCSRSHNVLDRQPKAILQKHGIDTNRQSRDILREFREAFRDREDFCQQMTSVEYDDDGGDVDEEDDSDDTQSEEGATGRASGIATGRRPPRKPSPPFGQPDERRRDEGDQRDDRPPEICVFGLGKGVCLYRTKCRNLHAGQPFLWQYVVPGRRATDEWASFDDECNRELEFNYADPNNDKCLSTLVRCPW